MTSKIAITDLLTLDLSDYSLKKNKLINYGYKLIEIKSLYNKECNIYVNEEHKTIFIISAPMNNILSNQLLHVDKSTSHEKLELLKHLLQYVKKREKEFDKIIENVKECFPKNNYKYVYVALSIGSYLVTNHFEKEDVVYLVNPFLTPAQVFCDKFKNNPNYTIFRCDGDIVSTFVELNNKLNVKEISLSIENEKAIVSQEKIHDSRNFKNTFIYLP